jgi:putative glutamine amidotransferase
MPTSSTSEVEGPSGAPRLAVLLGRDGTVRYSMHRGYVDAVLAIGAVPVLVAAAAVEHHAALLDLVCSCDGVIVTGGVDVDPALYGEAVDGAHDIDPERDEFEIAAVHAARAAGVRVLGICRGAQVVNVALGGTLHQDLPTAGFDGHWEAERQYEAVHGVVAEPGTLAAAVLGGATRINSIHHQAIKDPAPGVVVGARAPDGVIESIETDGVLAVQWHPERLFGADPGQLEIFRWVSGGAR